MRSMRSFPLCFGLVWLHVAFPCLVPTLCPLPHISTLPSSSWMALPSVAAVLRAPLFVLSVHHQLLPRMLPRLDDVSPPSPALHHVMSREMFRASGLFSVIDSFAVRSWRDCRHSFFIACSARSVK